MHKKKKTHLSAVEKTKQTYSVLKSHLNLQYNKNYKLLLPAHENKQN